MITQIDHDALGLSRLATQFRESTNLKNYILNLLVEANTLEQLFLDIINTRTIDSATDATLDFIGDLVGQSRNIIPTNGSPLLSLSDDAYRLYIKARITRNHTDSSPENLISEIGDGTVKGVASA